MSTDSRKCGKMLNELLKLKEQADIEPMAIDIKEENKIATYDFKAFQIERYKTAIIFRTTGFRVVSFPLYNQDENGGALYSQLVSLCEMKDEYDSLDETNKRLYEVVFNMVVSILSLPIDVFCDDDLLFGVATDITKRKAAFYKKLAKTPLREETEEDMIANDQFRQLVETSEELKRESED